MAGRPQDPVTKKFLSNEEIQRREEGQNARRGIATAVRDQRAPAADDEYDLGDSHFDPEQDLDPSDMRAPRPATGTNGVARTEDTSSQRQPAPSSRHHPKLVQRANGMGFSAEEIEGYTSEQLDDMLWRIKEEVARSRNEFGRDNPPAGPTRAPSGDTTPPEPVGRATDRQAGGSSPVKVDLSEFEAEFNKEFIAALEGAVSKIVTAHLGDRDQRIAKLSKDLEEVGGAVANAQHETRNQKIDRAFAALGDEFDAIVGRGSHAQLRESDRAAFARRVAIVNQAGQMTRKGEDLLQHIGAAASVLFGGGVAPKPKPKPQRRQQPVEEEEDIEAEQEAFSTDQNNQHWYNGGLRQPSSRRASAEPKGDRRAVRAVRDKMTEEGDYGDGGGNEEDGIPG